MPYGVSANASRRQLSVLRFAAPVGTPRKNVVLDANDATAFPVTAGARNVVPAGTILVDSTVSGKVTKISSGSQHIVGILIEDVDIVANSTAGYEPAAAFFQGVVFATDKVIGFTVYATDLAADLPLATFG